MRIRLLNLLLLAGLVLMAGRLAGFLRKPPPALPPIAAEQGTQAAAEQEAPVQEPLPAETRPEAFDVIVARDLFSPTRGVVQPAPAASAKPAPRPQQQPPPKLTLYGVVILDGEKFAFLQEGGADARPKKVREKDTFAGGTVSSIRPDGVTLLFGGNEVTIPLRTPKEVPAARGPDVGAAARAKATASQQRRTPQQPLAPGQMPIGGAQDQEPGAAGQEPLPTGMPVFPAAAEPTEDSGVQEEFFPEENVDVEVDPGLGSEEIVQ